MKGGSVDSKDMYAGANNELADKVEPSKLRYAIISVNSPSLEKPESPKSVQSNELALSDNHKELL